MTPLGLIKFVIGNFSDVKARTFLTILGIVVGVAAITTLFSLGDCLNATIADQFESFGKDSFFIEPDMTSGTSMLTTRITDRDIEIAEMVRGVNVVIPFYETAATATRGNKEGSFLIIGLDPEKASVLNETDYFELLEGRNLLKSDTYAFVTYEAPTEALFDEDISLRQSVNFNGKDFKIVGFYKENSFMSAAMGGLSMAIMNEDIVKDFFEIDEAIEAMVTIQPGYDAEEVALRVEEALEEEYGEKRFMVMTMDSLLEQMGMILLIVQGVLSFIALISLFVGTIGIVNTMIMNVNERVKEIGTMKAIGATNRTIQLIFMTEALILSLIGGILGVTLGYLTTWGIAQYIESTGFELVFVLNPTLIIIFIAFTAIIGVLAGTIPARMAAELEPTEALRYE